MSILITFESNGGSHIDDQVIENGNLIKIPEVPILSGYLFLNWYRDSEMTSVWDFRSNIPTTDITLYARWVNENSTNLDIFMGWYRDEGLTIPWDFESIPIFSNTIIYAKWGSLYPVVSFETFGGSILTPIILQYGDKITRVKTPSLDGFNFDGWYEDSTLLVKWDFDNNVVTRSITLYSKWVEVMDTMVIDIKSNIAGILNSYDSDTVKIHEIYTKRDKKCIMYENGRVIYNNGEASVVSYHFDMKKYISYGFVKSDDDIIRVYLFNNGIIEIVCLDTNDNREYTLPNNKYYIVQNSVGMYDDVLYVISGTLMKLDDNNKINKLGKIIVNEEEFIIVDHKLYSSCDTDSSIIHEMGYNMTKNKVFRDFEVLDYKVDSQSIIVVRDDGKAIRRRFNE